MKVLAITNMFPSPEFPSQGVFVQEQIKGLRTLGLDMRVLFINRRSDGMRAYFQMRHQVQAEMDEFRPDVVHAMYGGVMADQIVRHHRTRPIVVTYRGSDLLGENLSGWKRKIISRLGVHCSRWAAKRADAVIVVARHLASALNGAVPPEKVHVIPSGIDLARFQPMNSQVCKRTLGWNTNFFHVVFASSSGDPVKRPWLARAAVEKARRLGCPAEFHFATGIPTSEMPVWLNAGDALLLTSLHEGSPNIVKEALGCGLPVISVDVGDVAEQIKMLEGCHLAHAEPEDLGVKLHAVWQRGTRLENGCSRHVLSAADVAQKIKQVYEQAIGSWQPRSNHQTNQMRTVETGKLALESWQTEISNCVAERGSGR